MPKLHFPSIRAVAEILRDVNRNVEGDCEVRLQVYEDGLWAIRFGASDYDQDHRGYWGASWVPGVHNGHVVPFNGVLIARDLIEQAKEQATQNGEEIAHAD